jgi:hypothetical protein
MRNAEFRDYDILISISLSYYAVFDFKSLRPNYTKVPKVTYDKTGVVDRQLCPSIPM